MAWSFVLQGLPIGEVEAASDTFDQTAGNLNGKQMSAGGNWDTDDVTTNADFTVEATGHTAQRTTTSEASLAGRYALADTGTLTDTTVQVDFKFSAFPADGGAAGLFCLARYNDTNNYAYALLGADAVAGSSGAQLLVGKRVSGVSTQLGANAVMAISTGTWYTLKFTVEASGQYSASFWATSGSEPATPMVSGQSNAFAVGPLASGRYGFYDESTSATAITRNYDNFSAAQPEIPSTSLGKVEDAYERTLTLPLNGNPTAQFRMRLDDPLAQEIVSRNGDCLVKVYQDSTLRFVGDVMTVEEGGPVKEGEGVSVTVTAAGPLWRLSKRLIGTPYPSTASWSDTAMDQIIKALLDQANLDQGTLNRDTGIRWNGSNPTLYKASAGTDPTWAMKPVSEALTETQAAKVPFPLPAPPYYDARDDFTQAGDPSLDGLTATDTTVWDTTSTSGASDFTVVSASDYAQRTAGGDSSYTAGRWAISGTGSHGAVMVGINYEYDFPVASQSGFTIYSGVFARYQDSDHWVMAYVDLGSGALRIRKKNGAGTDTEWVSWTFTAAQAPTFGVRYALRLLVSDDGSYSVWHYSVGAEPERLISGRDADLATGGPLDAGSVGFYDAMGNSGPRNRAYYNFFAADDPIPQSFDFTFTPQEPTADANGVAIWTLDLDNQLGSEKPNVIFEYGDGNRTVKSYRRVIDRQGLVNHAYVLPQDFGSGGTDVRGADDPTSITTRGEYQEVIPADFGDSQLRQALADAHVAVRKIPRQLITFEPTSTAPTFGTDYIVGDIVTGRAKVDGSARFNALFRVYGVEISVDDEGKATITPTLVPS